MTQRIGVFGGTFDPPHYGHLILAQTAAEQLNLDHVLWVPAGLNPLKAGKNITSVAQRLRLVGAAISNNDMFSLCTVDTERPAPHYTIDTLRIIQTQYPNAELVFLMGGDSLASFARWRAPDEIINVAQLGVMRRPDDDIPLAALTELLPALEQRLSWIDAPLIEISATNLRRRTAQNKTIRYYVPELVRLLITDFALYAQE